MWWKPKQQVSNTRQHKELWHRLHTPGPRHREAVRELKRLRRERDAMPTM